MKSNYSTNQTPEIMYKFFSLSSYLTTEEKIKFLHELNKTNHVNAKKEMIDRALAGERIWIQTME